MLEYTGYVSYLWKAKMLTTQTIIYLLPFKLLHSHRSKLSTPRCYAISSPGMFRVNGSQPRRFANFRSYTTYAIFAYTVMIERMLGAYKKCCRVYPSYLRSLTLRLLN